MKNISKQTNKTSTRFKEKSLIALLALTSWNSAMAQNSGEVLTLDRFLEHVSQSHEEVQAARLQKEAAELRKDAGDLAELSPFLHGRAGFSNDQQETMMPAQQGTQTLAKYYSLGVGKSFATGTQVSLDWSQVHTDIRGTGFMTPAWESKYSLNVTQSLWKNSFGASTRLRHQREDAQTTLALLAAHMQWKQSIMNAESAYWNFAISDLNRKEKAEALTRAKRIHSWTSRRLRDGIADRADLLQVEALVAARELEQINSQDDYESAKKVLLDLLGKDSSFDIRISSDQLKRTRQLPKTEAQSRRIDVWMQNYTTKMSELGALETNDAFKPDLKLMGSFGANARDRALGASSSDAISSDNSVYTVGVALQMSLDFSLQRRLNQAAQADAKAARLRSERLNRDSTVSWDEYARKHKEMSARIAALEKLVSIQEAQLKRDQERLELGRAITFQVVNLEQEVANTRLQLLQLSGEQRKMEAAARLYMTQSEVEAL